jgi:hypothetical protein
MLSNIHYNVFPALYLEDRWEKLFLNDLLRAMDMNYFICLITNRKGNNGRYY